MTTLLIIITFFALLWISLAYELKHAPTIDKDEDTDYLPFEE